MLSATSESDDNVGAIEAWAVDVPDTKDENPLLCLPRRRVAHLPATGRVNQASIASYGI